MPNPENISCNGGHLDYFVDSIITCILNSSVRRVTVLPPIIKISNQNQTKQEPRNVSSYSLVIKLRKLPCYFQVYRVCSSEIYQGFCHSVVTIIDDTPEAASPPVTTLDRTPQAASSLPDYVDKIEATTINSKLKIFIKY